MQLFWTYQFLLDQMMLQKMYALYNKCYFHNVSLWKKSPSAALHHRI